MKQLTDLIEVSKGDLPSVYCDMDMVLCNFMKKADEVTGGSFVTADKVERWKQISSTKDFWANLEWMPAAGGAASTSIFCSSIAAKYRQ